MNARVDFRRQFSELSFGKGRCRRRRHEGQVVSISGAKEFGMHFSKRSTRETFHGSDNEEGIGGRHK